LDLAALEVERGHVVRLRAVQVDRAGVTLARDASPADRAHDAVTRVAGAPDRERLACRAQAHLARRVAPRGERLTALRALEQRAAAVGERERALQALRLQPRLGMKERHLGGRAGQVGGGDLLVRRIEHRVLARASHESLRMAQEEAIERVLLRYQEHEPLAAARDAPG